MKKVWNAIKGVAHRKQQVFRYLLFGILTTIFSLFAWYFTLRIGVIFLHDEAGEPTALLDVLGSTSQWIVGVLFAFFTNKKWVFTEAEHGGLVATKQFLVFSSSRILTYFLEVGINLGVIWLLEDLLGYRAPSFEVFGREMALSARIWAKVISSVAVVVSNYFISKLLVFRKKDEKDKKE